MQQHLSGEERKVRSAVVMEATLLIGHVVSEVTSGPSGYIEKNIARQTGIRKKEMAQEHQNVKFKSFS